MNKILKYLIFGVVLAAIIILVNWWNLGLKPLSLPSIQEPFPQIKIDFEILGSKEVQDLLPFEEISLPEKIGRENPFESY